MYTERNFKTKKALKEAVAGGEEVGTFQPGGLFPPKRNGTITLEGPHYPESHRWYAQAKVDEDGIIVKGTVK
jgi:hypothetical protein